MVFPNTNTCFSLDNPDRVPAALERIQETPEVIRNIEVILKNRSKYAYDGTYDYPPAYPTERYVRDHHFTCDRCHMCIRGIPLYVDPRREARQFIAAHEAKTRAMIWERTFPVDQDPWRHDQRRACDPFQGTDFAQDGPTPCYIFTGKPEFIETDESVWLEDGDYDSKGRRVQNRRAVVYPEKHHVPPPVHFPVEDYLKMLPDPNAELEQSDPRRTKRYSKVSFDWNTEAITVKVWEEFPDNNDEPPKPRNRYAHVFLDDEDENEDGQGQSKKQDQASEVNDSISDNGHFKCYYHPEKAVDGYYTCCGDIVYKRGGCKREENHSPSKQDFSDQIAEKLMQDWECFYLDKNPVGQSDFLVLSCVFGLNVRREWEAIRVAAIDLLSGQVLLDSLVYPSMEMLGYQTRDTGITRAMMEAAKNAGEVIESRDKVREIIGRFMNPRSKLILFNGPKALRALRIAMDDFRGWFSRDTGWQTHTRSTEWDTLELLRYEWNTGEYPCPPYRRGLNAEKAWIKPSIKEVAAKRLNRHIGKSKRFKEDPVEMAMAIRDLFMCHAKLFGYRDGYYAAWKAKEEELKLREDIENMILSDK